LEISAAILAGGRATRLQGADKASLLVGGRRIIERQLAALAEVAGEVRIIVAAGAGDAARYADLGVPIVADAVAGVGPLGGLYTALLEARYDRVLVLACDMPFVPAAVLQHLVIESGTGEQVDAVVPRSGAGLEPLCALYRRQTAPAVRALIDSGERRMTALLARLRVRAIDEGAFAPYDGGTLFMNVNTPHDYARARGQVEVVEKPSEDRITE
jgi:molybdopterin-guanine dinucleotide biosynthesis protein A